MLMNNFSSSLTFFCYSKVITLNTNILVKPTILANAGWWTGIDIQKISENIYAQICFYILFFRVNQF